LGREIETAKPGVAEILRVLYHFSLNRRLCMIAADAPTARSPLDVVSLSRLMERAVGRPEVAVGLIDGPVAADHVDLATENIRSLPSRLAGPSEPASGAASAHGTYVAGILSARRDSAAPAICPGCTLLVRPIFLEPAPGKADTPSASPGELADAIVDCVDAGARIVNLSVALATPSPNREPKLEQALDHAAARGTVVVAAAGNQGTVGGSAITRHPWVIPVVACNTQGRPMALSNLGSSIARRGLMAPGDAITSLGTNGQPVTSGGTSAAVPFVTGTMALLLSLLPDARTVDAKLAVTRADLRRASVVPPVLDAWASYQLMQNRRA
jgi:subtilisin family serine protease